jgi:hypothetical protein
MELINKLDMKKLILFFTVICFYCVLQAQTADDYQVDAEKGVAEAQYKLGNCYFNGEGVTKDYEKAVYWWTKAAEQKYAEAQYNIAKALDDITSMGIDLGLEADGNTALYWYEKALKNGLNSSEAKASKIAVKMLKEAGYSSSKITSKNGIKPALPYILVLVLLVIFDVGSILYKRMKRKKKISIVRKA